ncbi:unnamed protein product, partial [Effrenium voratum]
DWKARGTTKTADFEELEQAVPQKIYLKWVRQELADERACLELPFMIIVMISFTLMAVLALNQHTVLSVEQAIEQDILNNANFAFHEYHGHKKLLDVHSFGDFWSWLRLGMLPRTIQTRWEYSESRARDVSSVFALNTEPNSTWDFGDRVVPITGDYLHFNRIIGGLRFRQQVAAEAPCRFPTGGEKWQRWYGKPCVPAYQELAFEPDTSEGENFIRSERQEWLLISKDMQRMVDQVVDMEDGCSSRPSVDLCYCEWCKAQAPALPWLTERTQRVEVALASFNPEFGLLTLTGVNLWMARGGRMRKRVELMSVWITFSQPTLANVPMMVFASIWVLCLCYILLSEILEIFSVFRNAEQRWYKAFWEEYCKPWTLVDWLSICVAVWVMVLWMVLTFATGELQTQLGQLLDVSNPPPEQVAAFYEALEEVCAEEKRFRLLLCFYPMLLMLRLFKSFAAQPRLAVVTDTLSLASQDLLHFGIVLLAVMACLCLNGVLLFGRDLEEFGNLFRSLHSSFRMMFGDWEWGPMEEVSRAGAYLWFTMFMVLVVIILLNMLLAIILDNYMDVKKISASAQTLGQQMQEMRRRRQMQKAQERVKLSDVWRLFVDHEGGVKAALCSERPLTVSSLQDMVPGIPRPQAARTLQNSWMAHLKATTAPFELKHAQLPLCRFEAETRRLRNELYFIFDRLDFYDTRFKGGEKEEFSEAAQTDMAQEIASQMQRLSIEAAEKLAGLLSVADKTQTRIEEKQGSIHGTVREMTHMLLQLQSLGTQIGSRLEGLGYREPSTWAAWAWHAATKKKKKLSASERRANPRSKMDLVKVELFH